MDTCQNRLPMPIAFIQGDKDPPIDSKLSVKEPKGTSQ
jgi:hypothetical protein